MPCYANGDERKDKKSEGTRSESYDFSAASPASSPRARTAESINLCGNFRREPNAERSGYYISPWKSVKG